MQYVLCSVVKKCKVSESLSIYTGAGVVLIWFPNKTRHIKLYFYYQSIICKLF